MFHLHYQKTLRKYHHPLSNREVPFGPLSSSTKESMFESLDPYKIKNIRVPVSVISPESSSTTPYSYPTLLHYIIDALTQHKHYDHVISMKSEISLAEYYNELMPDMLRIYSDIGLKAGDKVTSSITGIEYIVKSALFKIMDVLRRDHNFVNALNDASSMRGVLTYKPVKSLDMFLGSININYNILGDAYTDLTAQLMDNLETTENSIEDIFATFPSLKLWTNSKIDDICRCLAYFFNYLAFDREGFVPVSVHSNNLLEIPAVINYKMVKWLLTEIFPCGDVSINNNIEPGKVPIYYIERMKMTINDNVKIKRSMLPPITTTTKDNNINIKIEDSALQYIWKYVSYNINYIMMGCHDDNDIQEKIELSQVNILSKNNCVNHGFNVAIHNCILNSFVYVMISLSDWLELDTMTKSEIITSVNIIVPYNLHERLNFDLDFDDGIINKIIRDAFVSRQFDISTDNCKLLSGVFDQIIKLLDSVDDVMFMKLTSRILFFSNNV